MADEFDTSSRLLVADSAEFYSVGPDRRDDHLLIIYDPTNGALSAGDVVARPKKKR
jgi:hypothetical protein